MLIIGEVGIWKFEYFITLNYTITATNTDLCLDRLCHKPSRQFYFISLMPDYKTYEPFSTLFLTRKWHLVIALTRGPWAVTSDTGQFLWQIPYPGYWTSPDWRTKHLKRSWNCGYNEKWCNIAYLRYCLKSDNCYESLNKVVIGLLDTFVSKQFTWQIPYLWCLSFHQSQH